MMPHISSETSGVQVLNGSDTTGYHSELFTLHSLPIDVLNPTEDDILDVMNKLVGKEFTGLHACYDLKDGRFVKQKGAQRHGGFEEARVMDFIRMHTKIPVPQVRMVFERDDSSYIVMDYISGTELHMLYRDCSPEELEDITRQLADIIQQIRAIPIAPQHFLGSWDGTPFRNIWFMPHPWDMHVMPSSVFQSVADFNSYWIKRSKLEILLPGTDQSDSKVVLSHGDLKPANIMIKDAKIVGIVDWDTFGWYPDFWELLPPRNIARTTPRWDMALQHVFGPPDEFSATYIKILDAAFEEPLRYELDLSFFNTDSAQH